MFSLKDRNGFTLLEILLTLSIITLIASTAVPAIDRILERQALSAYAYQIAADIRYVRQKNINGELLISITVSKDGYYIKDGVKIQKERPAPEGIECLNNEPPEFSFNLYGRPSKTETVNLQNSYGDRYKITVTPVTGRVKVVPVVTSL